MTAVEVKTVTTTSAQSYSFTNDVELRDLQNRIHRIEADLQRDVDRRFGLPDSPAYDNDVQHHKDQILLNIGRMKRDLLISKNWKVIVGVIRGDHNTALTRVVIHLPDKPAVFSPPYDGKIEFPPVERVRVAPAYNADAIKNYFAIAVNKNLEYPIDVVVLPSKSGKPEMERVDVIYHVTNRYQGSTRDPKPPIHAVYEFSLQKLYNVVDLDGNLDVDFHFF